MPVLQLNGVLMPNPFDRPRSVFMLEVTGAIGMGLKSNLLKAAIFIIFPTGVKIFKH